MHSIFMHCTGYSSSQVPGMHVSTSYLTRGKLKSLTISILPGAVIASVQNWRSWSHSPILATRGCDIRQPSGPSSFFGLVSVAVHNFAFLVHSLTPDPRWFTASQKGWLLPRLEIYFYSSACTLEVAVIQLGLSGNLWITELRGLPPSAVDRLLLA